MIATAAVATWRVWVTGADLREARQAWLRARDGGAPPDRVLELREDLDRMTRTAVFQARGDVPGDEHAGMGAAVVGPAAVDPAPAPGTPPATGLRRVPPPRRTRATG